MAYDAKTRRSTAEVVIGAQASQLMLSFTRTEGGVRDVRLVPAGTSAGQTFNAAFRAAIEPFSTLRLMDFFKTNANPSRTWSKRTAPATATQSGERGAAYEYAVQMANELGKDIWINVPALADDAYVRSLAECCSGLGRRGVRCTWSTATSCGTRSSRRPRRTASPRWRRLSRATPR